MNTLQAIVLAIIEGITEFCQFLRLDIWLSLLLFWIASDDFTKLFTIVIQLGAILSVVVLYFKRFFQTWDFILKLFVAFIPAGFWWIGRLIAFALVLFYEDQWFEHK
jgi:undecaprenyl-diphosphatase